MLRRELEIAILLLESGAEVGKAENTYLDGSPFPVTAVLRQCTFPLHSREYELKRQIIQLLKERGYDYKAEPIPEWTLNEIKELYPDTWQTYVELY